MRRFAIRLSLVGRIQESTRMLTQLQDNLWLCAVPYRAIGFPIGRQLVVIRLPAGGLWIQSPIPWTPALRTALAQLGEVRHVVAPNCYHDECLKEFQTEYPDATFHAAPGLADQRRDIRFAAKTLSDLPHPDWQSALGQHLVQGMPRLNEVIFLHRASRSLIITDIAMNFGSDSGWLVKLVMSINGGVGRFAPTGFCRSMMKDRPAVRASLNTILAWDFDRIIVGHGRNVETDGRRVFRDAFAFLP